MESVNTPVLVAGGGPAGLAAAAELSLHGIGCVVIEPRVAVSHRRPRAKTTSVRTMEHLRRWGIAGQLRLAAPLAVGWSQRVTFCESLAGRRITDFDGAFGLTTRRSELFAESGQQVPQPVVEDVLRTHLASRGGADLRFGWAVTGLEQDAGAVRVQVRDPDGAGHVVTARWVLGCDGAGGVVRDQIGARYVGRSDPRPNFNVVFRAPGLDTDLGPAVQYWVVGGRTTGLVGRLDLAGTWWAIMPGIEAEYGGAHAGELITDLIGAPDALSAGPAGSASLAEPAEPAGRAGPAGLEVLATDPWTARLLVADSFGCGRVFLVGEAAHVNPPWGGHGFNASVGDAVNIAWKIAAVEHGWASPGLLATYEQERRGVVEQTVACAEANMRAMAGDLPADEAVIQRAKRAEFHSLGLVLGYSYAGSAAIQPTVDGPGGPFVIADTTTYTPSAEPGARLPHAWLADGRSLYDQLGPGFTLVGPPGRDGPLIVEAGKRGIALTVVEAPAGYPWRDEFLLVRPDQHIAWRTKDLASIDLDLVTGHFPTIAADLARVALT